MRWMRRMGMGTTSGLLKRLPGSASTSLGNNEYDAAYETLIILLFNLQVLTKALLDSYGAYDGSMVTERGAINGCSI